MAFFQFQQSNPGGYYEFDEKICRVIVIEADSYDEAVEKALDMGVYFNGVEEGLDCPCCNDRWYRDDDTPPIEPLYGFIQADMITEEVLKKYNASIESETISDLLGLCYELRFKSIEDRLQYVTDNHWNNRHLKNKWNPEKGEWPDTRIFYANGTVKEIFRKD